VFVFSLGSREAAQQATRYWWLFVLTGIAWMVFALIVFRFSWASVLAIAVLFGTTAIVAGLFEFAVATASERGWKVLHFVLGVVFVAVGVVAYFTPGGTFVALAAVVSFFFVFAGSFDLISAFATRDENPAWWFQLLAGIAQIALGFWAAGNWNRSVVLLVAWVAASAVFRGVAALIFGFKLHALREDLEAVEARAGDGRRRSETVPSYGR
jgi:uncharacterized membrane protein HdeD (DUF308 family)